ncbi:MAG: fumarate hydratase, partial [Candidatus Omnitrophica bacterium]|nr:fumarate hydratase [Candidatus Omnitrophota bacterium]
MKTIQGRLITKTVKDLCIEANIELRDDILSALRSARRKESNAKARRVLDIIIYNARLAKRKKVPICQDTGMVVVYLKIGQGVRIKGDINKAAEKGMAQAYKDGYFRKSVVTDPLLR